MDGKCTKRMLTLATGLGFLIADLRPMTEEHQYQLALRLLEAEHNQPLVWLRKLAPSGEAFQLEAQQLPGRWAKTVHTKLHEVGRMVALHAAHGIRCIALGEEDYPERLAQANDPPPLLFVRGSLGSNDRVLAVVGTRSPTPDGLLHTDFWVNALGAARPTIVSGLALGIDAAAHGEALRSGLSTWAVLAHGLDAAQPRANARLAERILQSGGAWISEWPYGIPARAAHFPRRNRIIAGLSDAVLVVEASIKSGASITAKLAHGYDRTVFAIPGRIHDVHSQGCLSLIADQIAHMALHPEQVLSNLNWSARRQQGPQADLSKPLASVLEALRGPSRVEDLQKATGLPTEAVLSALAELIWTGRAYARSGTYHRRPLQGA